MGVRRPDEVLLAHSFECNWMQECDCSTIENRNLQHFMSILVNQLQACIQ